LRQQKLPHLLLRKHGVFANGFELVEHNKGSRRSAA
jgi:hypothetical protein